MLSKKNAHEAIETMFAQALKRMKELNEPNRICLYEEYKEWIEGLSDKGKGEDAIFFGYIGKSKIK